MPKATTNQDPDLDDVPGFATAEPAPAVGLPEDLGSEPEPESPPESQAPSTTSTPPPPPPKVPTTPTSPTSSTPESPSKVRQLDPELTDGLEFLAGGLFELIGQVANRFARARRRGQQSSLWLVTEDEAEAFAAPIARIAERHLPDELRTGDARDVVIAGSVAVEYAAHNAAGIPGLEHEAAPPPPPLAAPAATPPVAASPVSPARPDVPLVPPAAAAAVSVVDAAGIDGSPQAAPLVPADI